MLISYLDELAQSGNYDLQSDADVDIYLAALKGFTEDKGLAEWKITGEETVPRVRLHYDDTADGSNALNGSWREFYAAGCNWHEKPLFSGSDIFYKNGTPNFRGIAKAAIYLRYSAGFLNWLSELDHNVADRIKAEIPVFEKLVENEKTKKLISQWDKFKVPPGKWAIPVICSLSNNKHIVLGLSGKPEDDWDDFEDLDIDIAHSLELMSFLEAPANTELEVISDVFQMGKGLGRNAFGNSYKLDNITNSEYTRLMGPVPESSRQQLLNIWANKLGYRIKAAPDPDTSELIFVPEGTLKYSQLEKWIKAENDKVRQYYEQKSRKNQSHEDLEALRAYRPEVIPIPAHSKATLFLVNVEGGQKKKLIIQQVFPGISLRYLAVLNQELMITSTQNSVVSYMKAALTAQDRDTPSAYRYWTAVFSAALQKCYISADEVFFHFQRFCKAFSGEDLINAKTSPKGREYFRVIARLRRLQHLIHTAREAPEKLETSDFNLELKAVEQYQLTKKGVFGIMNKECPQSAELVGEVYDSLRENQKQKLEAFVRQAWQGVPNTEFSLFIRGALTGMLLNDLCYAVTQAGRSFSVTQGRHPSTLRGEQIQAVIDKGMGLLFNLGEQQRFNGNTLPFIYSCLADSRKDTFNSGLIMGLVFINKSSDKENQK
ncbi:MAG: hypothetical protein PHH77_04635 [Victivallaceae bacterium]|nr:hypothetical protein [Victivallaceae bacterium]